MSRNQYDQGVVGVFGSPPTTINDRNGKPITPVTLVNGTWKASAVFYAGAASDAILWLQGSIAGAGTAKVRVEGLRSDENNTALWEWASIQTTRADTGASAAEHTIAAAVLVGVVDAMKRQALVLRLVNAQRAGALRLVVAWQQAPDPADYLVVAVDAK